MATAHQVQAALQNAVTETLTITAVGGQPIGVTAAIGWPPIKVLQDAARAPGINAVIGVYDRASTKNVTRWGSLPLGQTMNPTGVTAAINTPVIAPGLQAIITLGGTILQGDAIGFLVGSITASLNVLTSNSTYQVTGTVGVLSVGTLAAAAMTLANAINSDPATNGLVSASASGSTVIVTSLSNVNLYVSTNSGNTGSLITEVGRRCRDLQIVVWTGTELARQAVSDPIEAMIATFETGDWLPLPDGTLGRVRFMDDYYIEQSSPMDLYRRDFHLDVEYPITTIDNLYSVLLLELQVTATAAVAAFSEG